MVVENKIVLITGGNNGIGYEAVKAFVNTNKHYRVLMGSRSLSKANAAIDKLRGETTGNNQVEPIQVDLSSDESISKCADKIKASYGRIDILINNAGANFDYEHIQGRATLRESFMKSYDVNVAGTQVLTNQLMPLLLKSSDPRLLFVTGLSNIVDASENYFPTPPQPAGWPKKVEFETIAYRTSKCGLNMIMVDWAHKLKADGVKVWAVNPGFLATDLGGMRDMVQEAGAGHPSEGGDVLLSIAEGAQDDTTGKIVGKDGVMQF